MPAVLEFFREKEPRFKDVSDEDLTIFIAETKPSFLRDAEFAASYYKQKPPPSLRPSAIAEAPVEPRALPPLPGDLQTPFATDLATESRRLTEQMEGAEGREVRAMSNAEVAKRYFSDILNPAPVPKLTAQDLKDAGIGQVGVGNRRISPEALAGVERATADLANFFASPLGTATLAIGALPPLAQRVVAGVFAVDLMRTTPEIARELGDAIGRGDTEAATEFTISGALNTLFAFGTARHALLGEMTPSRAIGRALMDRLRQPEVQAKMEQAAADEALRATLPGVAEVPGRPEIPGEPAFRVGDVAPEQPSVAPLTEAAARDVGATVEIKELPAPEPVVAKPATTEPVAKPRPLGLATMSPMEWLDYWQKTRGGETDPIAVLREHYEKIRQAVVDKAPINAKAAEQYEPDVAGSTKKVADHLKDIGYAKEGDYYFYKGKPVAKPEIAESAVVPEWRRLFDAEKITGRQGVTLRALEADTASIEQREVTGDVMTVVTFKNGVQKWLTVDGNLVEVPSWWTREASAGATELPVREQETAGRNVLTEPPPAQAEKVALETGIPPETPAQATAKAQAEVTETAKTEVQPEIIGMGAAAAGELDPSFRTSTGIKKAAVAEARAERGLEPIDAPERAPQEEAAAAMKQKLYDDPAYFDLLVEELTGKPRPINSDEVLALDMRYVQLQDEYGRAMREGEQAQADGRADAVIDAQRKADFWDAKLGEFERMVRATGTHWGRTGAMMQRRMMADFTLEKMEARARQAKGFEPLTADERAQIKALHDEIVAKDKAIAEQQETIAKLDAEKVILEAKAEAEKSPDYSPAVLEAAERFVKKLEAKSSEYLKDVLGATWTPGPEVLYKTAFIGATKLARIGLDFTRWSAEMVKDIGEKVRPYLAEIYERSKSILDEQIAAMAKTEPKDVGEKVRKAVKKEDVQGRMEEAKERIADSLEENDAGNITPQVKKLAEALWIKGVREVNPMIDELRTILSEFIPDISRQETMDALSGRGRFWQASQAEVKKGVRDLSTQARLLAHQIDVEARRPLPRTGYQPDKMSDAARREQQRLNELKKKFGVVVTDPAKQLASALQASKTYLRNRMTDLRQEIRTRERIVKTRTPLQPDAELQAMRKEFETLKEEHAQIFRKPEMTDAQRLKLALAAAERAEASWNKRLANAKKGDFSSLAKPGKKVTSAELEAIQARTEAVREQVKELKELAFPKKSPAERALQAALTRTRNAIADKLQRIASNDFSKRPKATPPTSLELLRLKGDLEKVKEQFRAREEKFKFDQLNIFQKAAKGAVHTWDALRTLMTTGEFSFVLRQGKFFAMSRPLTVAKAIPDMLRAFASERNARAAELAIREHPFYDVSQKAKLHISREGDSLTRQDEIVMGRWSNVIPIVKNFNRAATTFLNQLRFESWLAMRKTMSRLGKPTPEEDLMYARMANEATGRAPLGQAEAAAVTLGRVFFAPRYFISRIQMAMGHALWGGTARSRAVIATEYARHLIGMTIYYNLLMFGLNTLRKEDQAKVKLSFDPRSSDFGKIVIGKTRLDPLAGEAQLATFAGRTVTGETKSTTTGRVTPIRGKVPFGHPTWWEIAGRFAVSKAHPGITSAGALLAGKDLIGNISTVQTEAGKLVGPITYIDIYEALKAQGIPEGTALSILAFLGEGLQTYQPRQKNAPVR